VLGGESAIAIELADQVTTRWNNRSRYREAAAKVRETLAVTGDDYRLLHNLARSLTALGEISDALHYYESARHRCPPEDKQQKSAIIHNMAIIYAQQGQVTQALDLYQQSLTITEAIGNVKGKAATLHQMAGIYAQQGQVTQALDLYQQSLTIKEAIGDVQGKAATLAMLGQLLANKRQEYATAVRYLAEARSILSQLQSPDTQTVERMLNRILEVALVAQLRQQGSEDPQARLAELSPAERTALLAQAGIVF